MKFLVDENLSPRLVERLHRKGLIAAHVAHLGLGGMTDPALWTFAFENDYIVVTANARDFLRLASGAELHAGIIVLREAGLTGDEQWARLEPAIGALEGPLLNEVIDVLGPGKYARRKIPGE